MTPAERQRLLNLAAGLRQIGARLDTGLKEFLEIGNALIDQIEKVANGEQTISEREFEP